MREHPSVYVLATEDYRRIEVMLAGLSRALEVLFDRRLVEPSICPDDLGDFDEIADKVHKSYLF